MSSLANRKIALYDGKTWIASFGIIDRPIFKKGSRYISFILDPIPYDVFRDFTKGFTKFDLRVVRSFTNVYSMRMYEFVMQWKYLKVKKVSLKKFRDWLGVATEDYKRFDNFKAKVLTYMYDDLKANSPWYFDYELVLGEKEGRGRPPVTDIVFTFHENKDHKLSDGTSEGLAPLTLGAHPLSAYMSSFCYEWFTKGCISVINRTFSDKDLKANKNIELWQSFIEEDICLEEALKTFTDTRNKALAKAESQEAERKSKSPGYVIQALRTYWKDTLDRRDAELAHHSKQEWLHSINSVFNAGFHQRLLEFKGKNPQYASLDTTRLRESRFTLNRKFINPRTGKRVTVLRCSCFKDFYDYLKGDSGLIDFMNAFKQVEVMDLCVEYFILDNLDKTN